MADKISALLGEHYARTFREHGCSSKGVDWGPHEDRALLRHQKIIAVAEERPASLLDVGCGYGALLDLPEARGVDYTGLDIVPDMVAEGKKRHPKAAFIQGDFMEQDIKPGSFDYVVCNGILTQKLGASIAEMDAFSKKIIRKMFATCHKGIAFNMMTTHVNFMAENLFYKSPAELFGWVTEEISPKIKLDHTYLMFEYMVYVYK